MVDLYRNPFFYYTDDRAELVISELFIWIPVSKQIEIIIQLQSDT